MPKLGLDRAAIAKIAQGVPQTISALEKVFGDVAGFPSTIEEANALAGQALAAAHSALSTLALLADAIAQLESAPAAVPCADLDDTLPVTPRHAEDDDCAPRPHLGTMSSQNADAVEITGGTAALSTISASGQITSTVAPGAPPLVVASTALVANLYVARAAHADSADLGAPTTYPPAATDLASVITLANAIRAAATSKGL